VPRWTHNELAAYLRKARRPEPEPALCHEPLGSTKGKTKYPASIHVSITSWRLRPVDPDNLCPKYFIDCLKYAGIIPDDTPWDISLEIEQVQVEDRRDEGTEIVVSNSI
jgi:hypothetical protein